MYAPAPHDEITTIVHYVDQQLAAIRAALLGLTEDEARSRPCRSALSVAGIVQHVIYGMRGAIDTIQAKDTPAAPDAAAFAAYHASFVLTDQQTAEALVGDFDAARRE